MAKSQRPGVRFSDLRIRRNGQVKKLPADTPMPTEHEVERRLIDADLAGHAARAQAFAITNLAELGDDWIVHAPIVAESMTIVNACHDYPIDQYTEERAHYGTRAPRGIARIGGTGRHLKVSWGDTGTRFKTTHSRLFWTI